MLRHAVIALFSFVLLSACAATQTGGDTVMDSARFGRVEVDPSFAQVWSWSGTEYGETEVMTKQSENRVNKRVFVRAGADKDAGEILVLQSIEQRAARTIFVPGDSKYRVQLGADNYGCDVFTADTNKLKEHENSIPQVEAKGYTLHERYVMVLAQRLLNNTRAITIYYLLDLNLIPDDKRASDEQAIQYVLDRFKMSVRAEG